MALRVFRVRSYSSAGGRSSSALPFFSARPEATALLSAAFVLAWTTAQTLTPASALGGLFAPRDALREEARLALLAGEPGAAVQTARSALAADPAAPHRWADLGDALLVAAPSDAAEFAAAREAYRMAVERGPASVALLRRAVNFHFAIGENRQALALSRRLLWLDAEAAGSLFPLWNKMGISPYDAFAIGLPDEAAGRAYVRASLGGPSADAAWNLLAASHDPDPDLLDAYISQLLADRRFDRAIEVYRQESSCEKGSANLLRDGGFECGPGPTPLDWRRIAHPDARADWVEEAHAGSRALRVEFRGGGNPLYYHVSQQTPVEPGLYRVRVWIRSQGITTDEGVGIWVVDPHDSRRLSIATPTAVGTQDWSRFQRVFRVPEGVEMLEIRVFRRPSAQTRARLSGVAWVDDVTLEAVR